MADTSDCSVARFFPASPSRPSSGNASATGVGAPGTPQSCTEGRWRSERAHHPVGRRKGALAHDAPLGEEHGGREQAGCVSNTSEHTGPTRRAQAPQPWGRVMCDPTPDDRMLLGRINEALGDVVRGFWRLQVLRGFQDVAQAPSISIADATDAAYRIGRATGHADGRRETLEYCLQLLLAARRRDADSAVFSVERDLKAHLDEDGELA